MEKQRESHVKSLRLLQLEKAIQNMNPPELKEAYKAELKKMLKNVQ